MRCLIQISNVAFCFSISFSFAASNEVDGNLFLLADDLDHGGGLLTFLDSFKDDTEDQASTVSRSDDSSASLFSFNEDLASPAPKAEDLSSVLFPNDDSASAPLFYEDSAPILASGEASAFGDHGSPLPTLSEELEKPTENENFGSELDSGLLVDIGCKSYEEQIIGKAKRGEMCRPVAEKPSLEKSFPPPYSNQGRLNWLPENAPKPRPPRDKKNTRTDFESCPSGLSGYRMYAVCDSGKDSDTVFSDVRGWTLLNVDPGILLLPYPLDRCWHKITKS
jgi:hypothetical protein